MVIVHRASSLIKKHSFFSQPPEKVFKAFFFLKVPTRGIYWDRGISYNIFRIGVIKPTFHLKCCTCLKNQTLCTYKVDLE